MGNTELRRVEEINTGDNIFYVSNTGKVYRQLKNKPRREQFEHSSEKFLPFNDLWLR